MSGPEYLDDARPRPWRGRTSLVLALVVLVLVGLVVVRVRQPTEPSPEPTVTPSGSPSPNRDWPVGAGLAPGTLFIAADDHLNTIDASSGLLTTTRVTLDQFDAELTPLAGGVLVRPENGGPRKILLERGAVDYPVRGVLRTATSLLPGPDGSVWAAKIDPREPAEKNTWRRVDVDGQVRASVEVTGIAVADGAGGLLALDREQFRRVQPGPPGPRQPGDPVAVGPDGYLFRRCTTRCTGVLYDQVSDRYRDLPGELSDTTSEGALSPGNRFLAVKVPGEERSTVQIIPTESGGVLRSFPKPGSDQHSIVWLSDRWVALISEDRLMLYDAVADLMVTPDLPLSSIGALLWQPT